MKKPQGSGQHQNTNNPKTSPTSTAKSNFKHVENVPSILKRRLPFIHLQE